MANEPSGPVAPPPAGPGPWRSPLNRSLDTVWKFIENRAGIKTWALRGQPAFTFNPSYWTGAFVATAFLVQVLTGLLLLLYYVPSASPAVAGAPPQAWASTNYIITSVPMGWLLLSSHLYGAYATIFLAFVHFFRGFYTGVYKPPRELSWMVGTLLLVAMLGMGFTGYLLPYTALAVGATNVGISLTLSVPTLGPFAARLLISDGTNQGLLSRMFALHVVVIPLALAGLLYAHLSLFESHGIAPKATSDPRAKNTFTEEDDKKVGRFFPKVFLYMTKWGLLYVGMLLLIAAAWPWQLPVYFGSTTGAASPEPDWYFLWLYKLADFQYVTPAVAVGVVTALVVFVLFLPWIVQILPWLDGGKRRHPRDRPAMVFLANFLVSFFILMTIWGGIMPGVQIPASIYGTYIAILVAANAVPLLILYPLYKSNYRRRLLERELQRKSAAPAEGLVRAPVSLPSSPRPTAAPANQEAAPRA